MNVLEIKGLSVSFLDYGRGSGQQAANAIKQLDLSVGRGEIVAIVGASGSGKSLLAHAVMGILPRNAASAGTIRLNGKTLDGKELLRTRGKTLTLLPQSVGYLNPLLTVGRQLRGPSDDPAALDARRGLLERLGLGLGVERLFPFQLSGGMARKVLLAMSTRKEANLIIADEPTPGMGSDDVAQTIRYFRELSSAGSAVLIITHDLEAAASIASRVVVMKEGEVLEIAPASSFRGDGALLRHPYSRSLWQALPRNGFRRPIMEGNEADGIG
ncbi:ATP-binding cassette domain-containing protein [Paenibacillus sp. LHD-117]|uniref:ATP-binding cassette domain-containing protein n=1 Tax=Paenibacillus sp. LHD-117 TaxID=3071412 RepID=UPI0027DF4420|nr:ATP-binding cassette domain-containing protein [Paenibacillus sp. LHD-117]MDQ6419068.1 ATP-binding cassette domain-containing protein [Paenibacillus sp. LHD-117]